jgi:hypothetical protein
MRRMTCIGAGRGIGFREESSWRHVGFVYITSDDSWAWLRLKNFHSIVGLDYMRVTWKVHETPCCTKRQTPKSCNAGAISQGIKRHKAFPHIRRISLK